MSKIDKITSIIFILIFSISFIGLIVFSEKLYDKILFGIILITWILMFTRSFRLENYFKSKDSLNRISLFEHIAGIINNRKKIIGLVFIVRPVKKDNNFSKETKEINLLTYWIYTIVALVIFIILFSK